MINKTVQDLQTYLKEFKRLSKDLTPPQKKQLDTILKSILTLLVCFKKASHLGEMSIDFIDKFKS